MGIYKEFDQRLTRVLNRAIETARGTTLNRAAWGEVVKEIEAMKRLLEESAAFAGDSLRRAAVAKTNADTLDTLAIKQAEDYASAKLIGDNLDVFNFNDVGTVLDWLERVRSDVFKEAWGRLSDERRGELGTPARGVT